MIQTDLAPLALNVIKELLSDPKVNTTTRARLALGVVTLAGQCERAPDPDEIGDLARLSADRLRQLAAPAPALIAPRSAPDVVDVVSFSDADVADLLG